MRIYVHIKAHTPSGLWKEKNLVTHPCDQKALSVDHVYIGKSLTRWTKRVSLHRNNQLQRREIEYKIHTFLAVLNFCCIASLNVGFDRPGALHLSDQLVINIFAICKGFLHFQLDVFWTIETVRVQH